MASVGLRARLLSPPLALACPIKSNMFQFASPCPIKTNMIQALPFALPSLFLHLSKRAGQTSTTHNLVSISIRTHLSILRSNPYVSDWFKQHCLEAEELLFDVCHHF
eukprot:gb/GFBE01020036.1/.p1 GENE.gb/GFBE01020036.1/~~gb/GFBE01020036.1/.p1  ORF type:complete len:107 (+),score=19.78 gb/GFBE01020036.1/:1-321(+)